MHHRITEQPNLQRFLGWSLLGHFVALVAVSLTLSHSIRIAPAAAMQVKLVGIPQPAMPTKPKEEVQPVRTQDSAAPKEPPPEVKNIPPSEAKTKFLTDKPPEPVSDSKPNPIEAKERPPVLDKTLKDKKVVKNDLTAKVVKNPEDFIKVDDFLDKLQKTAPSKPTAAAPQTDKPAGDGPQIQLNMADNGVVSAIQGAINRNWTIPPGKDTKGLSITVQISLASDGNLTNIAVSRGSGDPAFDASLIRAVRKSIPLPIPADKFSKFQELELDFTSPN